MFFPEGARHRPGAGPTQSQRSHTSLCSTGQGPGPHRVNVHTPIHTPLSAPLARSRAHTESTFTHLSLLHWPGAGPTQSQRPHTSLSSTGQEPGPHRVNVHTPLSAPLARGRAHTESTFTHLSLLHWPGAGPTQSQRSYTSLSSTGQEPGPHRVNVHTPLSAPLARGRAHTESTFTHLSLHHWPGAGPTQSQRSYTSLCSTGQEPGPHRVNVYTPLSAPLTRGRAHTESTFTHLSLLHWPGAGPTQSQRSYTSLCSTGQEPGPHRVNVHTPLSAPLARGRAHTESTFTHLSLLHWPGAGPTQSQRSYTSLCSTGQEPGPHRVNVHTPLSAPLARGRAHTVSTSTHISLLHWPGAGPTQSQRSHTSLCSTGQEPGPHRVNVHTPLSAPLARGRATQSQRSYTSLC